MTTLDDNTLDTMNKLTEPTKQPTDYKDNIADMKASTTTLDDPTQNALGDDDLGSVDWDAPESRSGGSYTPQVYPGVYPFLFSLEDERPFEVREYDTKDGTHIKDFTINHKATVSVTDDNGEHKEVVIRFNQAGFSRTPKMKEKKINSSGGELLRSLGIPPEDIGGANPKRHLVEQALRQADGRTMGRGVVYWQAYCKSCNQGVTTSGRVRSNETRWPKGADGKYVAEVACPKCGATLAGRERITDYKLPQG